MLNKQVADGKVETCSSKGLKLLGERHHCQKKENFRGRTN